MFVWVAVLTASAMMLITFRSMAMALANSVDAHPRIAPVPREHAEDHDPVPFLRSHEAMMLMLEIAMAIGIALTTVGLAAMAALPGRMLVGALLAQVAVLGSLLAPAVSVRVGEVGIRPAAIALTLAQAANIIFFIKALTALL